MDLQLDLSGRSALVTGAASGIGEGVARRLASLGANVTVADVNDDLGHQVARDVAGVFVHTDVTDYESNLAAVDAAVDRFGGLDIAVLNAGVISNVVMGAEFDPLAYRRCMGVNLDGVVYGMNAAMRPMQASGGGDILVTASMAGIAPTPLDPIYAANKTAVVGLVRSFGLASTHFGIRTNAICPAFADTALIGPIRQGLHEAGVPLLDVEEVVDTYLAVLDSNQSGECWFVQPGRPAEAFAFRRAPGPRLADGSTASAADPEAQRRIAGR